MKKIILVAAVSSAIASPAFAVSYNALATSGTLAQPGDGMSSVNAFNSTERLQRYYVSDAAGTASDKSNVGIQGAVQLIRQSDWTFDFTDLNHVTFTGNIQVGDYKVQTNGTGVANLDSRQTYVGVTQSFSGVGTYDLATNTFTYVKPGVKFVAGGGSIQTQTSSSCVNGAVTSFLTLCDTFSRETPSWEGLALNFVFTEPGGSFIGTVKGTDLEGSGVTSYQFSYNWIITVPSGPLFASEVPISPVPVPASAWLFGSSLVGMIGAARRRKVAL